MTILTINAGSSSIKYCVFDSHMQLLMQGLIEGIGEKESHWHHQIHQKHTQKCAFPHHEAAFEQLSLRLQHDLHGQSIRGIGHRVVHGGEKYSKPVVITPEILREIQDLSVLAPIHNPVNAQGIDFMRKHYPDVLQVAVFDTGFHHTLPEKAWRYAIDKKTADSLHIRRYGFHGINHEYVARKAAQFLEKPFETCNFITLHLGNGSSACLIHQGLSVDTTMGMTPLGGLIMGTRCGDIDPGILLFLQRQGYDGDQLDALLNRNSGLKGLTQDNDMRRLCTRAEENDPDAKLALSIYAYTIQKTIGAYLSQTPTLDALIFTGGIGENASMIRLMILDSLQHFGFFLNPSENQRRFEEDCVNIHEKGTPILVIKGNEEWFIAQAVHKIAG